MSAKNLIVAECPHCFEDVPLGAAYAEQKHAWGKVVAFTCAVCKNAFTQRFRNHQLAEIAELIKVAHVEEEATQKHRCYRQKATLCAHADCDSQRIGNTVYGFKQQLDELDTLEIVFRDWGYEDTFAWTRVPREIGGYAALPKAQV